MVFVFIGLRCYQRWLVCDPNYATFSGPFCFKITYSPLFWCFTLCLAYPKEGSAKLVTLGKPALMAHSRCFIYISTVSFQWFATSGRVGHFFCHLWLEKLWSLRKRRKVMIVTDKFQDLPECWSSIWSRTCKKT